MGRLEGAGKAGEGVRAKAVEGWRGDCRGVDRRRLEVPASDN